MHTGHFQSANAADDLLLCGAASIPGCVVVVDETVCVDVFFISTVIPSFFIISVL